MDHPQSTYWHHLEFASPVLDVEYLSDELVINVVNHEVPRAGHKPPLQLHKKREKKFEIYKKNKVLKIWNYGHD